MIARSRVLLFETCLVFFVYNYQTKSLERQKYSTPCTKDNFVWRIGKLLFPYFYTLFVVVSAMIDAKFVAKNTAQAIGNLHRQGYFGQQIQHLLVLLESFKNKMYVDFGLS